MHQTDVIIAREWRKQISSSSKGPAGDFQNVKMFYYVFPEQLRVTLMCLAVDEEKKREAASDDDDSGDHDAVLFLFFIQLHSWRRKL